MKVFGFASLSAMTDVAMCIMQIGHRQDFFRFCCVDDGSDSVGGAPDEAAAPAETAPDSVVGLTKMGNDCCCIERYPQSFPISISK